MESHLQAFPVLSHLGLNLVPLNQGGKYRQSYCSTPWGSIARDLMASKTANWV
jgi:hypothetical protein